MKKSAWIILFYALPGFASEPECPNYRNFEIYVRNNTQDNCILKQDILRRGYRGSLSLFLSKPIKPNEEMLVYKTKDYAFQGSDVVLSYQCGANNFITFESERDTWAIAQVKGWVWNQASLDASYTTQYGACILDKPAHIEWTLY